MPVFRVIILYLAFLLLAALIRQKSKRPKTWVPPKTPRPPKRAVSTAGRESERDAGVNLAVSPAENGAAPLSPTAALEIPSPPLGEKPAVPVASAGTTEFLTPQNLLTGFILLEVLGPPRARRSRLRR